MRGFMGIVRSFFGDRGGNYAVMLVAVTLPLLMVVVKATDYTLMSRYRSDLQALADQVALATVGSMPVSLQAGREAGEGVYKTGLIELGDSFSSENLVLTLYDGPPYKAVVDITVTFKGLMGSTMTMSFETVQVHAEAENGAKDVEVAIGTDLSGSMDETELAVLVSAVRKLNDTLKEADARQPNSRIRVGFAPFSGLVSLPDYAWSWVSAASTVTPTSTPGRVCLGYRGSTYDATDVNPGDRPFPAYTRPASYCPTETVQPLSHSQTEISATIDTLAARTEFYTNTGVFNSLAWMYRILSPNWKNYWPADHQPEDLKYARKFAVIFTDGENRLDFGYTTNQANTLTSTACANMKANGITVYAITFKPPSTLKALYDGCASGASNHIEVNSDADLAAAFKEIADRILAPNILLSN